jgi:hypothetical protein
MIVSPFIPISCFDPYLHFELDILIDLFEKVYVSEIVPRLTDILNNKVLHA